MNAINRIFKMGTLIAIGAMMAAMISAVAFAQEPGPVGGLATPGSSEATTNAGAPPPLGNFSAHGSSNIYTFSAGATCGSSGLACSSGTACGCNISSGNAISQSLGSIQYSIQVLSDANTFLYNGVRIVGTPIPSDCTGASGLITLTVGKNTINMDSAGLICFTLHDQATYTGTYTVTGGGGKGKYSAAYGAGNVSWVITSTAPGGINNILYLTGTFAK